MRGWCFLVACVSCTYDFDSYTPSTGCEGVAFEGRCYFVTSSALAFPAANTACEGLGAHLAAVTSAAEQTAVAPLAKTDRWIGLRRPPGSTNDAKLFTWVTAESTAFTKWDAGEPDGSGECARMKPNGAWADASCAAEYIAICER